jgi:hypothetical protein
MSRHWWREDRPMACGLDTRRIKVRSSFSTKFSTTVHVDSYRGTSSSSGGAVCGRSWGAMNCPTGARIHCLAQQHDEVSPVSVAAQKAGSLAPSHLQCRWGPQCALWPLVVRHHIAEVPLCSTIAARTIGQVDFAGAWISWSSMLL